MLLQDYKKLFEKNNNITRIYNRGNIVWPSVLSAEYEPFYVKNISNENETLNIVKNYDSAPNITIEYKTDNTDWEPLGTTSTTPLTRSLAPGEKIYLKCNTNSWGVNNFNIIRGVSKVGGNIMSLLYGNDFADKTSFPSGSTFNFAGLFFNNYNLVDAHELLLPATTLTQQCYCRMFWGCTSLTSIPNLPATTLAIGCYLQIFKGCTSLTQAPSLPTTTLVHDCYKGMFSDCTSLTQAPSLPATTLVYGCYQYMFWGCTSLTQAPSLPATRLAEYCYSDMFHGCTSLTQAPSLPATRLAEYCYNDMFNGCTSLITAPSLPATALVERCYEGMFGGCTSLTSAPNLPATTLASYCYSSMFGGCTSLTQAPSLPATTLTAGCYRGMFNGCTSLNEVTCYATSGINENNSTTDWLLGVASAGTFYKKAGITWPTGTSGIPSGWTVVEQ